MNTEAYRPAWKFDKLTVKRADQQPESGDGGSGDSGAVVIFDLTALVDRSACDDCGTRYGGWQDVAYEGPETRSFKNITFVPAGRLHDSIILCNDNGTILLKVENVEWASMKLTRENGSFCILSVSGVAAVKSVEKLRRVMAEDPLRIVWEDSAPVLPLPMPGDGDAEDSDGDGDGMSCGSGSRRTGRAGSTTTITLTRPGRDDKSVTVSAGTLSRLANDPAYMDAALRRVAEKKAAEAAEAEKAH